ncbi:MAG: hypothetical protein GXO22_02540 [Aquificae bacterium]|nr:hypothetical protein [Aquificota bacterium]
MESRFTGCLVGAAIGDSMGMCVEEIPFDEVVLHYGGKITEPCEPHPLSPANFLKAGENSSEFLIVKLIAKSIAERGKIDIKDIINAYIKWEEQEELHMYVDPAFLVAIRSIKEGKEHTINSSSIEGALPAIPIGMYHYANPMLAVEGTKAVVMLTHRNEIVLDVASALAVSIGEALQGRFYFKDEYTYFIRLLQTFVSQKETKDYLEKVKLLLKGEASLEDAIKELGNGSYALEAFSLALFIFLKDSENTKEVIINAVNSYGDYGGDTDSIGLIAGALAGAYNSEESIPDSWKAKLKDYTQIVKIAKKLYKVSPHH